MQLPPSSPLPLHIPFTRLPLVRPSRSARPVLLGLAVLAALVVLYAGRTLLRQTAALLALPLLWPRTAAGRFLIDPALDGFDVTFASYGAGQTSAGPEFEDVVPPVLHHIVLGSGRRHGGLHRHKDDAAWHDARQSCLDWHPGWEARLWADDEADAFVAEYYPEFRDEWEGYQYPIQRIDALRYLVLYHFGGVILDMDLKCKRSLGPLRRFDFVAPAAHPTGISIGFMMASKRNAFVGEIVRSLSAYDRRWFWFPYPTVMFSTGCHFASTIHALQPNRTDLKVLAGPPSNPRMHTLSGRVSTPLFDHLGSSSWHGYDAALLTRLGRGGRWRVALIMVGVVCGALLVVIRPLKQMSALRGKPWYVRQARHSGARKAGEADLEGRLA